MSAEKITYSKVHELQPKQDRVNLRLRVKETKQVLSTTKADGTPLLQAEALVGDETGSIIFSARQEQIDLLTPGAYIDIKNGNVAMILDKSSNYMRLRVGKWGKITAAPETPSFEVNTGKCLSFVEYEQVDNK